MSEPEKRAALPQRRTPHTTGERVAITAERAAVKAADTLPFFGFFVEWRERRYARREAAALVASYHRIQQAEPALRGEQLYERVIMQRLECSAARARNVIRGADASFAQWPEERDVNFRDVVNYVVTHELMAAHDKRLGTRVDMMELFKREVPKEL